ncbi:MULTISPECIES: hypothetical protein [Wolbachia]|nr:MULTISPECIES: hypothetical protein [Wolbachia]QTP63040.1 hypothetical protein HUB95_03240 [Wolbachia endosymbiont of Ceratosolen solmsi]
MKVANTGFHPRGQCPLLVIPVLDTGIQEKEWCHPSSLTLASRKLNCK